MRVMQEDKKERLARIMEKKPLSDSDHSGRFNLEYLDYDERAGLTVRCHIEPWQRNVRGTLHGGFVCYYIDSAAGLATWLETGESALGTVDINVDFIRGIEESSSYIDVKAKVISIGRRIIVTTVEVRDADGWLMALGTTNFMRVLSPDDSPTIVNS